MKSFSDLIVWQQGLQLVKDIYQLTKKFPRDELYGMTSQIRRSSVSIIANIAEGFGRYTFADKANKYVIARGECSETETLLHLAVALLFITAEEAAVHIKRTQEIGRMISGLIISCQRKI